MQTVEIIVYLALAVMVGVMLLQFLTKWDIVDTYDKLSDILTGSDEPEFATVDRDEFIGQAVAFWQSCGLGEIDKTLTLFVQDQGTLNANFFFQRVKKLNMCDSLQSVNHQCGKRTNVVFTGDVQLPHIVMLRCDSVSEKLFIDAEGGAVMQTCIGESYKCCSSCQSGPQPSLDNTCATGQVCCQECT
jgi:hypothetical protein